MSAISAPRFLSISLISTSAFSRSIRAISAACACGCGVSGDRERSGLAIGGERELVGKDVSGVVESGDMGVDVEGIVEIPGGLLPTRLLGT